MGTSINDRALLANWGPVALWAALIFYFSTAAFSAPQTSHVLGPALTWLFPDISLDRFESIHLVLRKLGHWSEYFVFALLVLRALRRQSYGYPKLRHNAFTAAIVFFYAVSDELHQLFVPGRSASLADVLLDSLGGICAIIWVHLRHKRKKNAPPKGD